MKRAALVWWVAVGMGSLGLLAACSSRRSEPVTGRAASFPDARLHNGRVQFMAYCHKCHPGGEGGLGPALNDKPLPRFLIKTQVRVGLGAMPSFPPEILPERDLDDLVAYLKALRAIPPARANLR